MTFFRNKMNFRLFFGEQREILIKAAGPTITSLQTLDDDDNDDEEMK